MSAINPNYKPPGDYKPPQTKISEKVLIPQEEYPDINFVGLIIGPRGNTLKSMERDSGAKIIIRGKGSVKEGKLARKDGQPLPGEDEPLHAFVTGPTTESVIQAVAKINEVIRKGIELPENQNDLRRSQLRELALLNGTLRENDGPRCSNCGSSTHRSWQCPDKPNVTNNVFCTNCNGVGHIAKDCKERGADNNVNKAKIDEEYLSLMAELGEAPPPPQPTNKPHSANSSSKSSFMESGNSNNANRSQNNDAWNNGTEMQGAASANGASAWPGYGMPTAGYPADPYAAAYSQMWNQWGAVAPPPPPGSSTSDATNGATDPYAAMSASYDQSAQWTQYAQWYAAQAANGASGSGSSASAVPPPPPLTGVPPAPPMFAPPPPPPPPSH